jgi:hypothetical protein
LRYQVGCAASRSALPRERFSPLAQSRHGVHARRCPLSGAERTYCGVRRLSGYGIGRWPGPCHGRRRPLSLGCCEIPLHGIRRIVPRTLAIAHLRESAPSGLDPRHVRQLVRDALQDASYWTTDLVSGRNNLGRLLISRAYQRPVRRILSFALCWSPRGSPGRPAECDRVNAGLAP